MKLDFPIALRLHGRRVLLVGAGRIAEGRLLQLLEVGACVRVVAPRATVRIRELAAANRIELIERSYARGDCEGALVIFAAADDHGVNANVVADARARGILVNAADAPELCDFHMPSIGRRGPVTIALSTSGCAPALSRALRLRAMCAIGPEFGVLARVLGALRRIDRLPGRAARLQALADSDAASLIARGEQAALWKRVRQIWRAPGNSNDVEVSP